MITQRRTRETRKGLNHTSMVCNITRGRDVNYYKMEKRRERLSEMLISHQNGLDSFV